MIKQMLIFSVIGLLLVVPLANSNIFAQTLPSTVDIDNPTPFCGLNTPSTLVDYGSLTPNQISPPQFLNFVNTGNTPGLVTLQGTDWSSPSNPSVMNVGVTKYDAYVGLPTVTPDYSTRTALASFPVSLLTLPPDSGIPETTMTLTLQVKAVLNDPTFDGGLSQNLIFQFSC